MSFLADPWSAAGEITALPGGQLPPVPRRAPAAVQCRDPSPTLERPPLVSKIRVLLGMLVLLALAIGAIALLAAVKANPVWFTIVPLGILFLGASLIRSLGWFNKESR
ncbi:MULTISPECIES: hypothetical protein [unclassified Streptomyces]|uniref:hypothetical protein n=1 Tax=unclassified Streptomyces TaxID=2593676 RepID=UPI003668A385